MKLYKNERIVCPAIWVDDGKKYENQPENINTGYVVYGLHLVDIFYRMERRKKGKPINCSRLKLNKINEGYYTNLKRFIAGWITH